MKGDEALEDQALATEGREGIGAVARVAEHALALAVVAEAGGLEH